MSDTNCFLHWTPNKEIDSNGATAQMPNAESQYNTADTGILNLNSSFHCDLTVFGDVPFKISKLVSNKCIMKFLLFVCLVIMLINSIVFFFFFYKKYPC